MITTHEHLNDFIKRATEARVVALDTEFIWERTYYARLGVIQAAISENDCVLIDPLAFEDLSPLGDMIADPEIVKILHDAPQDLMLLKRACGKTPKNIFDTRCAAGFIGISSNISLNNLLKEVLNVSLPKTQTRSNWLQRPLTPEQVEYARDDVVHMPELHARILKKTEDFGRIDWLMEELSLLDDESLYHANSTREVFRKVKGFGRLSSREMAILRELAAWREEQARSADRPRGRVLADEALLNIAQRKPKEISKLKPGRYLSKKQIEKFGDIILSCVAEGLALPPEKCPTKPKRPSGGKSLEARIDFLLAYLKGKCVADSIDPALIASRSGVASLAEKGHETKPENNRLLRGWRRTYIGEDLLEILDGNKSVKLDPEGLPKALHSDS